MSEIDIRRAPGTFVLLVCPGCYLTRRLPLNWREITAADNPGWDGRLRCSKCRVDLLESERPPAP